MKYLFTYFQIIISFVFYTNDTCAQKNFISGSIITQNWDTLNGLIDYRNWKTNPTSVSFKKNDSDISIKYYPTTIKSFNVLDEIYLGEILNVNNSSTKINELSDSANFSYRIDTVFLQVMIQGSKSLYYYHDNLENAHFFILENNLFQELLYKRYVQNENSTSNIHENKRFVAQLSLYLNNCKTIQSKLSNINYSKNDLMKLFQYYNNCTNSAAKFEKKIDKIKVEVGIKAGMAISKLNFISDYFEYLSSEDFPKSTNIAEGLFLNLVLPRSNGKMSIYNEFLYTSYNTKATHNQYHAGQLEREINTNVGYSYIKLINMFRYKYPIKNSFMLFNAGISNGFVVSETNTRTDNYYYYQTIILENSLAINDSRKHEEGILFGLGNQYKNYSFEIRFEKSNGMSKFVTLNSSITRYYFLLGYTF